MTAPNAQLTSSTNAITSTLRDWILGYQSDDGKTRVVDYLTGEDAKPRWWVGLAPNNAVFPYAVMRFDQNNTGGSNGIRQVCPLEVQLYGRPTSQQPVLNDIADLIDQAMLSLVHSAQGLMFQQARQRSTLPPAGPPADSDTVTIRLVYTLIVWPQYLYRITHGLAPASEA